MRRSRGISGNSRALEVRAAVQERRDGGAEPARGVRERSSRRRRRDRARVESAGTVSVVEPPPPPEA